MEKCNIKRNRALSRYCHLRFISGSFRKGFTLVELLVVVLIIGILVAVALPQYQKAVEKAKARQVLPLLHALQHELTLYYLRYGHYPNNINELDITPPLWTGKQKWLGTSWVISNDDWSLQYGQMMNGMHGLSLGRIRGPYAGAGWVIYTSITDEVLQSYVGKVLCFETKKYTSLSFIDNGGTYGDYCTKLFGAQQLRDKNSGRWYQMP